MLLLSMAMLLPPTVCCAAVGTVGVAGVLGAVGVLGVVGVLPVSGFAGVVVDGGVAGFCDVDGLLGPALGVDCEEGVEFPPPPPPQQAAKVAVQINASTFFMSYHPFEIGSRSFCIREQVLIVLAMHLNQ